MRTFDSIGDVDLEPFRRFARAASLAAAALAKALLPIVAAAGALRAAIYKVAERAYRATHRRLPGSLRTARLRKKRRTRVLCWFFRELDRARAD